MSSKTTDRTDLRFNGVIIGDIFHDHDNALTLRKYVKSANLLKKWDAWSLMLSHLHAAQEAGAIRVLLIDERRREYRAPLALVLRAMPVKFPGYEPQVAMQRDRWDQKEPGAAKQMAMQL